MRYTIKRNGYPVATAKAEGNLTTRLMGESVVNMTFTLPEYVEFLTGDTVEIPNEGVFILSEPNFTELGKRRFEYNLKFVGEHYQLGNTQFMFYNESNQLTNGEFFITGQLIDFVSLVVKNANRNSSGWVVGAIHETDYKTLNFQNDNCLSVLTRLSDEFGIEFWIQGRAINFSKKGAQSGLSFRYGKGNGLRSLTREESDKKPVTRLFVFGSKDNLPTDYRSISRRLLMPAINGLSLEKNIDKYGVIEHTEFFDVKPEREGIITDVDGGDIYKFTDSTLDFDINQHLLPGVSAKVHFRTGQLAGYTFEIRENGYDHASREITINRNQDETALVLPNELIKPKVGDKYVLLDIQMPASYVEAAEIKLYNEAQAWLDANSVRKVTYIAETDPLHLKRNNIKVNLGDYVNISSTPANIGVDIRVSGRIVNLTNLNDQQLELQDEVNISAMVKQVFTQREVERAISRNRLNDAARSRMNWRTAQETLSMIFNPETGKMDGEKIEAGTISAQALSVGTTSQNFQLKGIIFEPGFEGDNTQLAWTSGELVHNVIQANGGIWTIPAGIASGLSVSTAYYVYAKCSKSSTSGTIEITEDMVAVESEEGYYMFWIGVLNSVIDDFRALSTTYGLTTINGAMITAGLIKNTLGENVLDIDNRVFYGEFKIKGTNADVAQELIDLAAQASNAEQNATEANNYINTVLPMELSEIWDQLDGVVETWSGDYDPTLANFPADQWVTNNDKDAHIGDTFYNTVNGKGFRFVKDSNGYKWAEIDSDSAEALALAQQAKDLADGKRRTFVSTPYPPYDPGDLWAQGPSGELMRCIVGRQTGSYNAADWVKAAKYTDDTVANQAKSDAEAAQIAASNAASTATSANNKLADIASDSKLTPSEKQATKKEWDIIQSELSTIQAQASKYSISSTAYTNAYNDLSSYITPLLSNLTTTTNITGSTFRTNFKNYYDAKVALLKAISDKAKDLADAADSKATAASNAAAIAAANALQAQNTANAAHEVTSYLFTTINDALVATGTFLVGNASGNNAGLTGVGTGNNNVFLWGGSTYANRNTAPLRLYRNGDAVFNQLTATGGTIGGFKIFSSHLESNVSYEGGRFTLNPGAGFIAFIRTGVWAGFGLNVLPATFGESRAVARFENTLTNQFGFNYGLFIDVAGSSINNVALHVNRGDAVFGGAEYWEGVKHIPSTYTCGPNDRFLITPTNSNPTITLPPNARKGRLITIQHRNSSGTIHAGSGNGLIYHQTTGGSSSVSIGNNWHTYIFDGNNWYLVGAR